MTVEDLPGYLKKHWPMIPGQLLAGSYRPSPVLRKEIPKPGGGVRELGIPTAPAYFVVVQRRF
jgi:RNA-directed DNA polymerase